MIDSKPALRLWGVPELVSNKVEVFGSERRYQLLAWLAVRSGEWMARDQAAALLWPEHEPADARRNLRKVLLDARAVPGVAGLESTDLALRWSVDTDLGKFDALLRSGPTQRATAVALRRGTLLDAMDLPSNPAWTEWLQAQRAHWDARWQSAAHEQLKAVAETVGRGDLAQQLLALDPLDDEAMAAWIESCVAQGALAAARQAWRVYADRLAQELGIEPPARLRALLDAAQSPAPVQAAVQPASGRSLTAPASTPTEDFIGRRFEIAELKTLILRPDVRLVTLLGPGGVGKSRLAMQALPLLGEALGGPTLTVTMHDLDSVRELSTRLAQQLGVTLNESREATAQLAAKLGAATDTTPRLLLLDNGEHLADLGAWVGQLADSAPRLKLLVTSRARLNVRGEHVLPLQGLMLPDEDSRDIDAAPSFDAVRLFATRAAAALPGFSLSQHLPAVIEIVQQCAGWPLAIELAAAWVRLLPPQEIARELRQSVDVLERDPGSQQLPSRPEHASMRAVLEQSFRLLAPREREALEALTVFRGRFTRAAAQAVTSVAIPLLASLVDKSLLEADGSGQFGLHPLVAAEGQQRLQQDTARAATLSERHAEYFLRSLAVANTIVNTETRQAEMLIDAHEADLRRAWHHALELRRGDLVASTLPEWSSFYQRRGRLREGAAMLQPALQWPADGPDGDLVQGRARAAVARLWFMVQEPLETVHALAEAGLDHARRAADAQAQAACLAVRASCDSERGRFQLAREGFEQALALAEAQGHVGTAIRCLRNLGSVATRAGDYKTALTYTRRAQMRAREAGHTHAEVDAMFAQAGPLLESADWSGAEQVLRQALQLAAPLGARQLLLNGRCMRGCALIELGRLAEAEDELKQVFRDAGELGQPHLQMYADTYMALAAARGGRLDDAEQALRGVAVRASEADWTKEAMRALLFQGEVLAHRGDRLAAAAAWRAVAAEASIPAGERDTARRWLAELALSDDESARAEAIVPDAQQALRTHLLRPSAD